MRVDIHQDVYIDDLGHRTSPCVDINLFTDARADEGPHQGMPNCYEAFRKPFGAQMRWYRVNTDAKFKVSAAKLYEEKVFDQHVPRVHMRVPGLGRSRSDDMESYEQIESGGTLLIRQGDRIGLEYLPDGFPGAPVQGRGHGAPPRNRGQHGDALPR